MERDGGNFRCLGAEIWRLVTGNTGNLLFPLKKTLGCGLRPFVRNVAQGTIFRSLAPFVAVDVLRVALLVAVPGLVLFLPSQM